ncbi:putative MFS family arabinose efflux permease [Paenibacillus taihuensis]|uniref:Putative MFS family arabinose efflux permease n=1 Tax=Paenibacillus taihuensis TaxID=1156355 RepID=A0A3D9RZ81_9BACL|nr:MFS transporter [Paenibacillus taihuensis]REE85177.1 putative MFS family arabinose efflux permease [Paenibacillus taihuensis]
MSFWNHIISVFKRKELSEQRRGLLTSIIEGIPAVIIANLLGGPILTIYIVYLGGTASDVGLVMAIPALANLVQLVAAFYMQKFTNRRLLLTIFGVLHRTFWVATGLIPFLVPEHLRVGVFIGLFLMSFLSASASSVFWTSLVADMVPPQVRGRYFGIRNTIHWAVGSIVLLVGGQILEQLNDQTGFIILYAISAVCTIWNGMELWRYPNPPFQKSEASSSAALFLKPLKDRGFMKATLFIALYILLQNIAIPLFSYVMLETLHISKWMITLITTVQMVVTMFSYYYWGNLNTKYDARTLLLWALPIIASSCVLWAGIEIIPVILVLVLVNIVLGFGLGGYNLLVFNFIIGDTPKSDRPMYVALFAALTGATGFVGPLLGGWIYKQIEDSPYWLQSYGISLFVGAALLVLALTIGPLVLREERSGVESEQAG